MKSFKEIITEIDAKKIVADKLGNINSLKNIEIPSHEERKETMLRRAREEEERLAAKKAKAKPKDVKESIADTLAQIQKDADRANKHKELMAKHREANKPAMDKIRDAEANRPVKKLTKQEVDKITADGHAEHDYNRKRGWSTE